MVFEVIRGHHPDPKITGLWGHLRSKFKDFQTLTPSFGVKIKKRSGQKFASSEARGYKEKTVQPIALSEARGFEEDTGPSIASTEARV